MRFYLSLLFVAAFASAVASNFDSSSVAFNLDGCEARDEDMKMLVAERSDGTREQIYYEISKAGFRIQAPHFYFTTEKEQNYTKPICLPAFILQGNFLAVVNSTLGVFMGRKENALVSTNRNKMKYQKDKWILREDNVLEYESGIGAHTVDKTKNCVYTIKGNNGPVPYEYPCEQVTLRLEPFPHTDIPKCYAWGYSLPPRKLDIGEDSADVSQPPASDEGGRTASGTTENGAGNGGNGESRIPR